MNKEEYANWLENMVILLSKCYMELVRESDESTLKKVSTPHSNEIRCAIRTIAEEATADCKEVSNGEISAYTRAVIQNHSSKKSKRFEIERIF